MIVSATPIRPNCSTRALEAGRLAAGEGLDSDESTDSAPLISPARTLTSSRSSFSVTPIRRAAAHSAACANIASAYTTTELTRTRLE
jgi:hypothetical protein